MIKIFSAMKKIVITSMILAIPCFAQSVYKQNPDEWYKAAVNGDFGGGSQGKWSGHVPYDKDAWPNSIIELSFDGEGLDPFNRLSIKGSMVIKTKFWKHRELRAKTLSSTVTLDTPDGFQSHLWDSNDLTIKKSDGYFCITITTTIDGDPTETSFCFPPYSSTTTTHLSIPGYSSLIAIRVDFAIKDPGKVHSEER